MRTIYLTDYSVSFGRRKCTIAPKHHGFNKHCCQLSIIVKIMIIVFSYFFYLKALLSNNIKDFAILSCLHTYLVDKW